jgi:hypothetical protein
MFLIYNPLVRTLYASEAEWMLPASMVWIAERNERFDDCSRWALRAIEMGSSSSIVEGLGKRTRSFRLTKTLSLQVFGQALSVVTDTAWSR